MTKDLTSSSVQRQNIINNPFALAEIENAIGIRGIPFENRRVVLLDQVAFFFGVTTRTIKRCIEENREELSQNGYEVLKGNRLKNLVESISEIDGRDINVPTISRASVLGVFDFKALVNVAMLLTGSERAKLLRKVILEIVIDTINHKSGGSTKYVNQRDEEFLQAAFSGENYRREFTDALKNYLEMGPAKYPIYTDKVYKLIFLENAKEYRRILKLDKKDKTRETFYSEVLDLVASIETEFADKLKKESENKKRKLDPWEADVLLDEIGEYRLLVPLMNAARAKMASRDLAFRDALHQQLAGYIVPIDPGEYERFLGDKSKELDKRLEDAKDVMKRLKDR